MHSIHSLKLTSLADLASSQLLLRLSPSTVEGRLVTLCLDAARFLIEFRFVRAKGVLGGVGCLPSMP